MRYELSLPWVHPNDFWGTLRPGQQSQVIPNAPVGMVFPGDAGISRGLIGTDKNNVITSYSIHYTKLYEAFERV